MPKTGWGFCLGPFFNRQGETERETERERERETERERERERERATRSPRSGHAPVDLFVCRRIFDLFAQTPIAAPWHLLHRDFSAQAGCLKGADDAALLAFASALRLAKQPMRAEVLC